MLQGYSENITINAEQPIPYNNVSIEKGCTAKLIAPATIQFNKCGVYMVSFNMSASSATAGDISAQLSKNGVLQPQAIATQSVEAGGTGNISFLTLVQVPFNNSNCPCVSPTTVQVINSIAVTDADVNIVVTKVS